MSHSMNFNLGITKRQILGIDTFSVFALLLALPMLGYGKNVILFVGDGIGLTTTSAAQIPRLRIRIGTGKKNTLSFEDLPHIALIRPHD